jgi:hypothetical protein
MDFARHQYETDVLREQLRIREEVSSKYQRTHLFLNDQIGWKGNILRFIFLYADEKIVYENQKSMKFKSEFSKFHNSLVAFDVFSPKARTVSML